MYAPINIFVLRAWCNLKKTPDENMSISWTFLRLSPVVLRRVIATRRRLFAIARTQIQHHRQLRAYRKCAGREFETRSRGVFQTKLKEVRLNISRKHKKLLKQMANYPSMKKHIELTNLVYSSEAADRVNNIVEYLKTEDELRGLAASNQGEFLVDMKNIQYQQVHVLPALTFAKLSFSITDRASYRKISTDVLFLNVMENARRACSKRVFEDFDAIRQLQFATTDILVREYEKATRQRSGNRSQNLQFGSYILQLAHFVMLEKHSSREARAPLENHPAYREHLDLLVSLLGRLTEFYVNYDKPTIAQLPCAFTRSIEQQQHHISQVLVRIARLLTFGHLVATVKNTNN